MDHRTLGTLLIVLSAPGCAHMSLKDKPVREIRVESAEAGGLCPDEDRKLVVTAVMGDGHEETTTGAGHGKVGWNSFHVSLSDGWADGGTIRVGADPRRRWSTPVTLEVTARDHPEVHWSGTVPVRYDCPLRAEFGGPAGSDGSSGSSGDDATSDGHTGDRGSDGSRGGEGGNAHDVEAWITVVEGPDQRTLVQAAVDDGSGRSYFAFNPEGGTLVIDARGGPGGTGGAGGNGGRGGHAAKDVRQGHGGDGGDGACGGDGGDGGAVLVHLDPSAEAYADRVEIDTDGGDGGAGGSSGSGGRGSPWGRTGAAGCGGRAGHSGRKDVRHEPVEPLW